MKREFRKARLSKPNLFKLDLINSIIEEYQADGYVLTLRQLYYQLVSRAVIPNKQSEYAKLSKLLKEGRMSGIVDWNAIEDRLRVPKLPYYSRDLADALDDVHRQYRLPRQDDQSVYLEVWVEKDALSGVLSRVTEKYHIPIMVNRGYSSVSAMHDAFMRFVRRGAYKDRDVTILYLGDHDPSGLDMIRDIDSRLYEFKENYNDGWAVDQMIINVEHIALTTQQIEQYNPPPNPTKVTDPRAADYLAEHGHTCWEVDALKPEVLNGLLEESILSFMDGSKFSAWIDKEEKDKAILKSIIDAHK